jgi:hypothetical protein
MESQMRNKCGHAAEDDEGWFGATWEDDVRRMHVEAATWEWFQAQGDVRATLRAALRRALRKVGYRPEKAESPAKTVLARTELLTVSWTAGG